MAQNPYVLLGLSQTATDDEIRNAYRRLAKELHPDLNPGNASAADRFKNVSAAYNIVGDTENRKKFDRGLIDANGDPVRGFAGAGAGGHSGKRFDNGDFTDIFSDIFGGGFAGPGGAQRPRRGRGQDVRYTLEIDFLESVQGAKKRVTLPEGGVLDLSVPAGVTDGKTLRLKGKGGQGFGGGPAGDALVEIKMSPHAQFQREKNDILITLPITINEAIVGGKIEVPTITGRVNLTIPKGTSSGRTFRLKGKGVAPAGSGDTGDQLVTVEIVLPDEIDGELEAFLKSWAEKNSYDPRKG